MNREATTTTTTIKIKKYFVLLCTPPQKYGMMRLEGAAHFYLGPVTENIVVLC